MLDTSKYTVVDDLLLLEKGTLAALQVKPCCIQQKVQHGWLTESWASVTASCIRVIKDAQDHMTLHLQVASCKNQLVAVTCYAHWATYRQHELARTLMIHNRCI